MAGLAECIIDTVGDTPWVTKMLLQVPQVVIDNGGFDWSTVIANCIVALGAIAGSVIVVWRTNKANRESWSEQVKRSNEQLTQQQMHAEHQLRTQLEHERILRLRDDRKDLYPEYLKHLEAAAAAVHSIGMLYEYTKGTWQPDEVGEITRDFVWRQLGEIRDELKRQVEAINEINAQVGVLFSDAILPTTQEIRDALRDASTNLDFYLTANQDYMPISMLESHLGSLGAAMQQTATDLYQRINEWITAARTEVAS